ncbi:MAG: hypothetical protein HY843_06570 [Bdellovibrio sp.]|nr:hypothetical protein [Bdellovibrio sp.]
MLKKGRHLANILILFYILTLFSGLLVIILQAKQLYLGFYCLALCVYVFFLFFLLRHEKNRSFWAPPWKWYQGLPESIPHLKCEVFQGEKKEILKVCRLDAEGSFLFNNLHTSLIQLDVRRLVELVFRFKDKKVRCRGIVKKVLHSDLGVGIQFCNISPDTQKELGDFVELLKGEGYVS